MRRVLLKASDSRWLRENATRYRFLRRSVDRFMPGESIADALRASVELSRHNIGAILTRLGENVSDRAEAEAVTIHYLQVLEAIRTQGLPIEVSVKLTQLGLDLDESFCESNLSRLVSKSTPGQTLWVDMEQSSYAERTLRTVHSIRKSHPQVGVCVQAYLHRTEADLDRLIANGVAVRLVKGAYNEPSSVAFSKKMEVDNSYFRLAQKLLGSEARGNRVRAALATHDRGLIHRIAAWASFEGLNNDEIEFQMLYGIQKGEQLRLAKQGYRSRVLIAYGPYWFPWFMRRLAERPANVLLLARNLFAGQ